MAWKCITVNVNNDTFLGHANDDLFSIPCSSGLEAGDSFKVGAINYKVVSVTDGAYAGTVISFFTLLRLLEEIVHAVTFETPYSR